ncbi:hypothetical protein GCM10009539_17100 [Cryptosporangium japonicum]|uniref:Uncharacterized protein n=1 Tax=Cryptosporangium japonicum TaxID=80872 RepID=A0ABP3DGS3_9ACTN
MRCSTARIAGAFGSCGAVRTYRGNMLAATATGPIVRIAARTWRLRKNAAFTCPDARVPHRSPAVARTPSSAGFPPVRSCSPVPIQYLPPEGPGTSFWKRTPGSPATPYRCGADRSAHREARGRASDETGEEAWPSRCVNWQPN